jgi:hypothetical protein
LIRTLELEKDNSFLPLSKIQEKIILLSDKEDALYNEIENGLTGAKVKLVNMRKNTFRGFPSSEDYAKRDKEVKELKQKSTHTRASMGLKWFLILIFQFIILVLMVKLSTDFFGDVIGSGVMLLMIVYMAFYFILRIWRPIKKAESNAWRAERDWEEFQRNFTRRAHNEKKLVHVIQQIEQQKTQLAVSKQEIPHLEEKVILLKQKIKGCESEIGINYDLIKEMIPFSERLKLE